MKQPLYPDAATLARVNAQEPVAFFDKVYAAYLAAEQTAGGANNHFYTIGGFIIRLRFAGPALVPYFTRALAHLATDPVAEVDLTICIWDDRSTRTNLPACPWPPENRLRHGLIHGFNTERICTILSVMNQQFSLELLDLQRNLGIYFCHNPGQIPYWLVASPLYKIFYVWIEQRGLQLIHAGAVGLPSGGVLFVGRGGSGKSTLALSCLQSDLSYASDDHCLLGSDPVPTVYSLYGTGKKNADDIQRLPELLDVISNREKLKTEKALYFVNEHFPHKMLLQFPLKAILIPKFTPQTNTSIIPASTASALIALAPSSIFQLPGTAPQAFKRIGKLIKDIPAYTLNIGSVPHHAVPIIRNLIEVGQVVK